MTDVVKDVASAAEQSRLFRTLARGGYAANGLVHVLIGALAFVVATGGQGRSDQAGAFGVLRDSVVGLPLLWTAALLLVALGAWHALEAVRIRRPGTIATWGMRVSEVGQAVVFITLGVIAVAVALGGRPDGDEAARDVSSGVLTVPGGVFLIAAAGLGLVIGGIAFVVMGLKRSFRNKVSIPDGAWGVVVSASGLVGFIAKGVSLAAIGLLLLVAALREDARAAGALDAAIQALLEQSFGPPLVAGIGVGLVVYGLFCFVRARYARL